MKLAVELGADLNLINTDGRTALDAAKALRYQSVVDFLVAKGAKAGALCTGSGAVEAAAAVADRPQTR